MAIVGSVVNDDGIVGIIALGVIAIGGGLCGCEKLGAGSLAQGWGRGKGIFLGTVAGVAVDP